MRTLASHEAYYQRWARTWEYQALLKARPVAGDADLGQQYADMVAPMVWSAASRPNFVADVQAMRRRVEENIPRPEVDRQVKLGPGGLRDIEFAVQLLQLVHGRPTAGCAPGSTLPALEQLTDNGYIGRMDSATLAESYVFLRNVEHRLQLQRLRRTHVVPTEPDALRWLARADGLPGRRAVQRGARPARPRGPPAAREAVLPAAARRGGAAARPTTPASTPG